MTAKVSEKAVFCLIGSGDNGKTTLLKILRYIFADYGTRVMCDSLLDNKGWASNTENSDLADLCGSRFATTSELKRGVKLAEHRVKDYTSMDLVKVRRMRENPFTFKPTHKFFIDSNYVPMVEGRDHGIWRRLKYIPFRIRIPEKEQDPELYDKLVAEAAGILNWMTAGSRKWRESGLQEPTEIIDATRTWKEQDDYVQQYFEDCCSFNAEFCSPVEHLASEFESWMARNAVKASKDDHLIPWIRAKGLVWSTPRTVEGRTKRVVDGVRLRTYAMNYRIEGKSNVREARAADVDREEEEARKAKEPSVSVRTGVSPEVPLDEELTDKLTPYNVH